jgi:hypothetical protein
VIDPLGKQVPSVLHGVVKQAVAGAVVRGGGVAFLKKKSELQSVFLVLCRGHKLQTRWVCRRLERVGGFFFV